MLLPRIIAGAYFDSPYTLSNAVAQSQRMKRRNHIIAVTLFVLTLGSPLLIAGAKPLAIKVSNSAKIKYAQGDYQGALSDYNRLLELDPQDLDALDNRSATKAQLGDYRGAIADANKSLRINPQNPKALNNRGAARVYLNDYQGALADFSKAIEINPRDAFAYTNRCAIKKELQDHQGAIADCSTAVEINPQDAFAYNNRGVSVYNLNRDAESACNDFKQAASLGYEPRIKWLKSEEGKWCRDM